MLAPSSKMSRHIFIQSLLFAVLFVILLIWISSPQARFSSDTVSTAVSTADSTVVSTAVSTAASTAAPARLQPDIPNYAHFVFLLEKPESDFPFVFFQYLSMYAAWYYLRPDKIYLHTDAREQQIKRAREGLAGKWSKLIFEIPGLTINHVKSPTVARNGVKIQHMAHKSDFIRVEAIREFGGLYMDFDVFAIRDLRQLLTSGFESISGREPGGLMTAGAFLAQKQSKIMNMWAEQMHQVFDQGWITHSNGLMTRIGEQLIPDPRQILVLEQDAFTPVTYSPGGVESFLESHQNVPSALQDHKDGETLPFLNHYDEPQGSGAMNFNKSYSVHAFRIEETGIEVSPRSILERRSDIGRVLYPVVRDMYNQGVISLDEK
ncbi:glycosyltransferase sugar-binding domain-containing protein [Hirsutella rhossiliensis]|uniref:Glycosyltransferase sugar-binding domain-containing protein n=1 Tax=Hirsutella rhossiliensis TaxID=111463 RepID=A0A9P8MYU7_9HYPO|nr:glycosyltransferase sugar-binding domain-containing protein [Hirsutella rhossiliensis]KAH0963744.1 glycosyltransferase sugar-binding domain-containing protein [Hirsutella rhossiliensis]